MEKYIIGGNSSGKTRRMLEEAKNTRAIVVCKNPYSMEEKAKSYGIFGLKFVSYEDMHNVPIYDEDIAIDEIVDFFKYYFGANLNSFTMTVE